MMRFHGQSIPLVLAIVAASLCGGCVPTEDDPPTRSGGANGTSTGGQDATSGGSGGSTTGNAGTPGTPSVGVGGSGGAANPDAGTAGGDDARAGLGGSGGLGGQPGAGGTGGTNAYSPCPTDGTPCKILPFGDSITNGDKSSDRGGYRTPLYKLILAAKQKATFVGSLMDGPTQVSGQPFPRNNEGHGGWTIDPRPNTRPGGYSGISTLVPSPALDGNPNIILLMIGTNDLFGGDTANMATRLESLLDKLVQNAPNALIVLATLTPLSNSAANAAATAYNAKIPGIVQMRAEKGQHIIGVDMNELPASQLADGTHPNDQGYASLANIWYEAIKGLLPQ
jgi:hypothetical protein